MLKHTRGELDPQLVARVHACSCRPATENKKAFARPTASRYDLGQKARTSSNHPPHGVTLGTARGLSHDTFVGQVLTNAFRPLSNVHSGRSRTRWSARLDFDYDGSSLARCLPMLWLAVPCLFVCCYRCASRLVTEGFCFVDHRLTGFMIIVDVRLLSGAVHTIRTCGQLSRNTALACASIVTTSVSDA